MQAVILAAGRGERMGSLTTLTPKPMLSVAGKNLLQHKLDILPNNIDEVIIVVGYLGSTIQKHFGGSYKDKRILYVEQEAPCGTADALWQARDILHDRFLVLNGDDIYVQEDIIRATAHTEGWYVLAKETPDVFSGGAVEISEQGRVLGITEGAHTGGLAGMNAFVLDVRVFQCAMVPKAPGSAEFGLPQTVFAAAQHFGISLSVEKADFWLQITTPEDLVRVPVLLRK